MDKNYFVSQLKEFSESYQINVDEDILGEIVNKATFRVISKGEIIASIGENTMAAALVLSGLARCYYIDNDGNDITRGFAPEGTMWLDEGFFGYPERICMWETLEESAIMFCRTADIRELIGILVESDIVVVSVCGIKSDKIIYSPIATAEIQLHNFFRPGADLDDEINRNAEPFCCFKSVLTVDNLHFLIDEDWNRLITDLVDAVNDSINLGFIQRPVAVQLFKLSIITRLKYLYICEDHVYAFHQYSSNALITNVMSFGISSDSNAPNGVFAVELFACVWNTNSSPRATA